jgi:hypothetical protein
MVHSVHSNGLSRHQLALLERALLVLSKLDEGGWHELPPDLRVSFARYMDPEVWTHLPDLLTYRQASLKIVRDAIAHVGEFSLCSADRAAAEGPPKILVAG